MFAAKVVCLRSPGFWGISRADDFWDVERKLGRLGVHGDHVVVLEKAVDPTLGDSGVEHFGSGNPGHSDVPTRCGLLAISPKHTHDLDQVHMLFWRQLWTQQVYEDERRYLLVQGRPDHRRGVR